MSRHLLFLFIVSLPLFGFSQTNCSNPVHLTICPDTTLTNQTNGGMLDDMPGTCNLAGEDLVYEIYVPDSAVRIMVSIMNATGPSRLILTTGTCAPTSCYTRYAYTGNTNLYFTVNRSNYYYLWINAATTITFDIAIGADTTSQNVNIPNTQGNFGFDFTCASQPFANNKPFFEVEYNSVYCFRPLTFPSLGTSGLLCVSIYLENLTGVSGVKQFSFSFNAAGYSVVAPVSSTIPGFFNPGNWILSGSGGSYQYTFNDSAGIGRGDFDGSPNSCLKYTFCFNITPVSNSPSLTDVDVLVISDSYGAGYYGTVYGGCCPSGIPNCHSGGGGAIGGAMGLSFGFNDPGGPLPITLLNFDATAAKNQVRLNWQTASEINNDYFTIERSSDGEKWISISTIKGSGNTTTNTEYESVDTKPLSGVSYYRLKQTDYDGSSQTFDAVRVNYTPDKLICYPVPAHDVIYFNKEFAEGSQIWLVNLLGEKKMLNTFMSDGKPALDVSTLEIGIYLLEIDDGFSLQSSRIVINR